MTSLATAVTVAAVAGVATYAIRVSFLAVAHRTGDLGPRTRAALRMIPPAALAALVAPALARPTGELDLLGPRAIAGLIALLVAWRSRNVLATIVVGMAALLLLERVL